MSTPAEYGPPVREGLSIFYKDVEMCLQMESVDFVLDPIVNPYKYTLLLPADPQIRKKSMATDKIGFHSIDCMYDLFSDLKYFSSSITDQHCYGLTLGDIVHEDMSLYTTYTDECESLPFPMYNCIGNHDKDIKWRFRTISIREAESVRAALPKYSYRLWTWKGGVGYIGEKRVDDSIQIQAYGNNTYGDGCVYANVFMWDEKWSEVTLTTSTGKKYVMAQVPTNDPNAYDAAESELVDHYLKHSTRYKELNGSRLQGVTHLFRVKPDESTGKGTVSVTDRFGDTFTYEVAW